MTTEDAAGVVNTNPRKQRRSFLYAEEDIVVKPSTELIPDEYEHLSNDTVLFHIFRTDIDADFDEDLLETMGRINYKIDKTKLHYISETKTFIADLETIKKGSINKSALFLIFIGFFEKDGYLYMTDETESSLSNIHIKNIWNMFSANNCPELKNKPKIFFFCTSRKPVASVQPDSRLHRTMLYDKVYDFPAEADMLIIYIKTEDTTQRVKDAFLSQLCLNIQGYSKKYDIIDLISHKQKSIPLIISTLTRKFYLTPSNEREHYLSIIEYNESLDSGLRTITDVVEKLQEIQRKKKDKKFSFSFRKKNDEKPKILKNQNITTDKSKTLKSPVISDGTRLNSPLPFPTGTRSRNQSESESVRKISNASRPSTSKTRPMWKN